jgi:hypothetical protein
MGGWDQNGSWGDWLEVEWIQLAQHRDHWRALVNMVISLRVLAPRNLFVVEIVGTPITKYLNVFLAKEKACV